ncbi:MAG: hypothetical protein IKL31_00720, partial [Ruminococcus sp.]|nr:hypothetical protein [Ruminococcus sp.]
EANSSDNEANSSDNETNFNSDMPAIKDQLGIDKQQGGLVNFMRNCSTPMTIAIQGGWGTGKTSMMQQLKKKLENDHFGSALWFPTWQFAVIGEQDRLLMDLLMLLCCKLEEKYSKLDKKIFDEVIKFLKSFDYKRFGFSLLKSGVSKGIKKVEGKTGLEFEKAFKEATAGDETAITYESFVKQASKLHEDMTALITLYLEATNTKRMYIFIDDLDRLEPVRAVELLEGIKNFLDIPQCVFILAIDTEVVKEGLKEKYGANMDEDKRTHFFDKIIQVPYKLPVHNYKLDKFMKTVLKTYVKEEWQAESDVKIDEIAPKYVQFLDDADIHNPRTIKRCVNFCLLHKYMDGNDYKDKDKDIDFHRFVIKMLELEKVEKYWVILAKIRSSGEDYTGIRDWLLSEKDLQFRLFHEVLKRFEIDENADLIKVKLFADYIIRSAPADVISLKYLGAAQMVYDIFQRIATNGKNSMKKNAHVSPTLEKIDIAKISPMEIAKIFERHERSSFIIEDINVVLFKKIGLSITHNLYQSLSILIKSELLNRDFADSLIYEYNQTQNPENEIKYLYSWDKHCFWNIKDTSSPDAPIYKILEKTGIIDNDLDPA